MSRNITRGDGVLRIVTANQIFAFVCFSDNRFEILILLHKYLDANRVNAASVPDIPGFSQRIFNV